MGVGARVVAFKGLGQLLITAMVISAFATAEPTFAETIEGQVLSAGSPIARSSVTMWSTSTDAPRQLGQAQSDGDGRFTLNFDVPSGSRGSLYLVALGGQPAGQAASRA